MQLCVALDLPTKEENLELVKKIKDYDVWLKVGLRSYIRDGKEFLDELKKINSDFKIFLDLKLYDIPNTMADAAESIMSLDVDMFNVHASAGKRAMQTVMQRLKKYEKVQKRHIYQNSLILLSKSNLSLKSRKSLKLFLKKYPYTVSFESLFFVKLYHFC